MVALHMYSPGRSGSYPSTFRSGSNLTDTRVVSTDDSFVDSGAIIGSRGTDEVA